MSFMCGPPEMAGGVDMAGDTEWTLGEWCDRWWKLEGDRDWKGPPDRRCATISAIPFCMDAWLCWISATRDSRLRMRLKKWINEGRRKGVVQ